MADVLFIMGADRSGSTALERLLAGHDGTVAVGELRHLWDSGFDDPRLCSCGRPINECPFWTDVRGRASGFDARAAAHLSRSVMRIRYAPFMHFSLPPRRLQRELAEARTMMSGLYDAISEAAGGRLIVDSSKVPSSAHMLEGLDEVRAVFVHLVRDSRGVAFSQQRTRVRPQVHWRTETMRRLRPAKSAAIWDSRFAGSLALLPYARGRVVQLRYEDFAHDPSNALRLLRSLLERSGMRSLGAATTEAGWYHSFHGNPMRFNRDFAIKADEEWRTHMSRRDRAVTAAVTLPFLALHRYRVGFR